MVPNVIDYGIDSDGRVEIELGEGFERDASVSLTRKVMAAVTGTPP